MTLAGCTASHDWLDAKMKVVGYRPIQSSTSWRESRMLLGVAVQEVVQHFQVQPPIVHAITDESLRAIQPSSSAPRSGTTSNSNTPPRQRNISSMGNDDAPPDYDTFVQQPDGPTATATLPMSSSSSSSTSINAPTNEELRKLDAMDREGLEKLLQDPIALVAFCNAELAFPKELNDKRQTVLKENAAKAKANLARQEELQTLHAQVSELQKQLRTQTKEFQQQWETKQNEICAVPDRSVILSDLYQAKKQAFDDSERMAETWLEDGAPNIKEFCQAFVEARKLHHLRAGKMEILQQQQ